MKNDGLLVLFRHGESLYNVAKKGVFFKSEEARSLIRGLPNHLGRG